MLIHLPIGSYGTLYQNHSVTFHAEYRLLSVLCGTQLHLLHGISLSSLHDVCNCRIYDQNGSDVRIPHLNPLNLLAHHF